MNKQNFPYPKINRPKLSKDNNDHQKISETFDTIEAYIEIIGQYIYTDININYPEDDEKFILSRMQHIFSSSLYRSLYLRNGIVDAVNSRNIVCIFTNLKSFIEVPAYLMQLYSIIESGADQKELLEKLIDTALGNKGKGELRAGHRDSVNVMTMLEKLDKFINKADGQEKVKAKSKKVNYMTEFYELVCNASHPNYDAHSLTGFLDYKNGLWRIYTPDEVKARIVDDAMWYMPALNTTILMIRFMGQKIMDHKFINNFELLSSPKLFS